MVQLIEAFQSKDWEISFGTTSSKNQNSIDLTSLGIKEYQLELNSSLFDDLILEIRPSIVLFDRFMIEEQFGWRVAELLPSTLRILDTEDLHSLRKIRQECLKQEIEFSSSLFLDSEIAKREIASIYRCDLALMISSFEIKLLKEIFKVPDSLLHYVPFFLDPCDESQRTNWLNFELRTDFVSIGNFLHPPNLDATLQLKTVIWPKIRKKLPKAQLHIYGAYPSQQILQLHNLKEGFIVHGFIENADEVIAKAKVLLAPLRFGAGLKGKLIQAMQNGTPSVTTSIGAEAMNGDFSWPGFIEDDLDSFSEKAVRLYNRKEDWETAQRNGVQIINELYNRKWHQKILIVRIKKLIENLESHRSQNFIGQMLQHHTMKSYKYLSKWIEEKNKD